MLDTSTHLSGNGISGCAVPVPAKNSSESDLQLQKSSKAACEKQLEDTKLELILLKFS